MISDEEWRPVVGYEGLYSVNREGLVVSHRRSNRRGSGQIRGIEEYVFAASLDPDTLTRVLLTKNGRKRMCNLRRIVFEAFVGPVPDGCFVQSKRSAPRSVAVEDLELTTYSECNSADDRRRGAAARIDQAQKLRREGRTHREIADLMRCNERTIRKYLKMDPPDLSSCGLQAAHAMGLSPREAARAADVDKSVAQRVLNAIESGIIIQGDRSATIKFLCWMHANRERMEAST